MCDRAEWWLSPITGGAEREFPREAAGRRNAAFHRVELFGEMAMATIELRVRECDADNRAFQFVARITHRRRERAAHVDRKNRDRRSSASRADNRARSRRHASSDLVRSLTRARRDHSTADQCGKVFAIERMPLEPTYGSSLSSCRRDDERSSRGGRSGGAHKRDGRKLVAVPRFCVPRSCRILPQCHRAASRWNEKQAGAERRQV